MLLYLIYAILSRIFYYSKIGQNKRGFATSYVMVTWIVVVNDVPSGL